MLHDLIKQKESDLNPQKPFLKGAAILGLAAIAAHELELADTTTKSPSLLFPMPLFWAACGAASSLFLLYQFVGHEMAIIIETKGTLKKLTHEIDTWQQIIPELQHNQLEVSQKMKGALAVLDSIIPIVTKLSVPDPIENPQITAIENEITELKKLVAAIAETQLHGASITPTTTGNIKKLSTLSEKLFGKKTKKTVL